MKSMIVEITDETNVAQAWGIFPLPWSLGTSMGFVFRHPLRVRLLCSINSKPTDRRVSGQACGKISSDLWRFCISQRIPVLSALCGLGDRHCTFMPHCLYVYDRGT